jgi:(p)ppGpp synthase/HD superfamily hydrolase
MKLTERFNQAMVYAAQLHANQVRKGNKNVPYISHLMAVSSIALEYGADEDQAIAALLHDAVEDQGGKPTLEVIRQRFGETVAQIVDDCTDTDETIKPPWRKRKEDYIAHLAHVLPASRLVSCADKLHNARTITQDYRLVGEDLWGRFKGGREGTLWYYRTITNVFKTLELHPIVDELDRVVTELERITAQKGG